MPHTKSAQKMVKVAQKKRSRNRSVRSMVKTYIARAEKLMLSEQLEPAKEAVTQAISTLDKAAQKRVIHPNNAARRKSRLMKKLNRAQGLPSD